MKKNLIVESNSGDKKLQKTYGYLNPNASDEALEGFATMTTALTTNEYQGAYLVTKRGINEPEVPTGKPSHNISVSEFTGLQAVITAPEGTNFKVYGGSLSGSTLTADDYCGIIYAPETDDCAATIVDWALPLKDNLIVYLPFDDSVNQDLCGKTWTITGSPSISSTNAFTGNALQVSGANYISTEDDFYLGGRDFTVDFYSYINYTGTTAYAGLFGIFIVDSDASVNSSTNGADYIFLSINRNKSLSSYYINIRNGDTTNNPTYNLTLNKLSHFAFVYEHDKRLFTNYIDGKVVLTQTAYYTRLLCKYIWLNYNFGDPTRSMTGSFDEFRIFDGLARWTGEFTPPKADEYSFLKAQFAA